MKNTTDISKIFKNAVAVIGIDYSEEETMDVSEEVVPDIYIELEIPIYEKQLKDAIRFKTSYIRNFLNYSVSSYNDVYDAELTYLLMEYFETHNPHVFDLILVDNLKAENWKRICAAEIYFGAKMFDWKCINEFYNIYNNLLWDCVYNEDFTNIDNFTLLTIPEDYNNCVMENDQSSGIFITYSLKASFTSNGHNYIVWFNDENGYFTVLDIDRVD